jgi:hypothetical protein
MHPMIQRLLARCVPARHGRSQTTGGADRRARVDARRVTTRGVLVMTALALIAVSSDASADVNNPGDFKLDGTLDTIFQGPTKLINLNQTDLMDVTVNADGSMDISSISFPAASATGITSSTSGSPAISVRIVPQLSGNSASIDISTGDVFISFRVKLSFTYAGQVQSCDTSAFTIATSTRKTFTTNGNHINGIAYNTSNGEFTGVASDLTIPAFSTSSCDSSTNRTNLSNAYGVGATAGSAGMKLDVGVIHDTSSNPISL